MNLLLIPYNYVLNPEIRKEINLNIKDKIIILDEAHNIESSAENCFSRTLSYTDFRKTLNDLAEIYKY